MAIHPNGKRIYIALEGIERIVVFEAGRPSRIIWRLPVHFGASALAVAH